MALASGEKPSTFLDRCKSGTPKIQLDLNRLNRLASLGLPRRVPCSNQGRDSPSDSVDRKVDSPASKGGDSLCSQVGGKTSSQSVESSEARKRKADRDVSSCRERAQGRQVEGRAHPNIRSNLDLVPDVRSRRAIDSAKEVLVFQDKENINPCGDYISREPKKLASDRSAEKRRLQVSSKLQNVPNGRKVGSLLLKSRGRVGRNDAGVPSLLHQNGFLEKEQVHQVSIHESYPLPDGQEEHQLDCDMLTPTDSMSISYAHPEQNNDVHHLQTHTDTEGHMLDIPKENEHRDGVLTSVKELSSSMNGLALADANLHDDLQSSSIPQNSNNKCADPHLSSHPTTASDGRQAASSVQATALHPAGTACSITIRTESAPLATTFTDENVQPVGCKSSQENVECKQQLGSMPKTEKQSPPKSVVAENGAVKPELERSSQDDVPISDIGAGKLVQHLQMPERKPVVNSGDVVMQPKKQGENDYFVWVNGKRYQKLKKIGRGGSSEVYKVIDRDSNIYALKRIKLKGRDYATACGFYQEIELLNRLQGKKYIIRLIDHEVTDKKLFSYDVDGSHIIRHDAHIYMVLEFGEVDLATMLQDKLKERAQNNNQIDETWLRFYWQQILEAVNTVHEERIMHADLKPANFLLVKGVLKLIDFGIAKSIQGDTTNIERDAQVGTLNYMSPEAFLMNEKDENGNIIKCGRSSDIWALGCILYQMVYGKTPFAHITALHAKIQEVANPRHKINYPPVSNPYLLDIMKKCLSYNRDERLRIPELLKHPFLQPQLAQPNVSKNIEEEILLEILSEEKQGRDVTALRRVLERIRMLK